MENDIQFMTYTVEKVEPVEKGWTVTFDGGWCLFVTNEQCQQEPIVGESIRLYGEGFGFPIRGIIIGGRVYRYESQADHEKSQAEMSERLRKEREEADAAFRAKEKPKLAEFKKRNVENWEECVKNNQDAYGFRCVQFAADWASFMEREMAKGRALSDCAKETSREADHDGITGFMYGAAVNILAHCWEHGEELRRWHNKDTQIGTEGDRANESGGVLNPAILVVGSES